MKSNTNYANQVKEEKIKERVKMGDEIIQLRKFLSMTEMFCVDYFNGFRNVKNLNQRLAEIQREIKAHLPKVRKMIAENRCTTEEAIFVETRFPARYDK